MLFSILYFILLKSSCSYIYVKLILIDLTLIYIILVSYFIHLFIFSYLYDLKSLFYVYYIKKSNFKN